MLEDVKIGARRGLKNCNKPKIIKESEKVVKDVPFGTHTKRNKPNSFVCELYQTFSELLNSTLIQVVVENSKRIQAHPNRPFFIQN